MRIERFAEALERAARASSSVVPPASGSVVPPASGANAEVPPASGQQAQTVVLVGRLDQLQQSVEALRTDETAFRSLPGFET